MVAVLNARAAPIVQQMKGDALVFGGGVKLWTGIDTSPKESNPVRNAALA